MPRMSNEDIAAKLLAEMVDHTIEDLTDNTYVADIKDISGQKSMSADRAKKIARKMKNLLGAFKEDYL